MKTIEFDFGGTHYILTYTRDSVRQMERAGFVASEVADKPMLMLPELFAGAFIANHKYTPRKVRDEIFEAIGNRTELLGKLTEMYNATIESLMGNGDGDEGNVTWTASW